MRPDTGHLERARIDPRLDAVAGDVFRDVAAQAVALSGCDAILVPALNPGYHGRKGSASDPFVADLPAALARALPGLPPLWSVPVDPTDPTVEETALRQLLAISSSPGSVRRLWQRHRADAKPPRLPASRDVGAGEVAWVGQPWNVNDERLAAFPTALVRGPSAHRMNPSDLRDEGWRFDPGLAPTDAEAVGAVRRFARRGSIKEIRVLVDPSCSADAWLLRRARALAGGKVTAWNVATATPLDDPPTTSTDEGTSPSAALGEG